MLYAARLINQMAVCPVDQPAVPMLNQGPVDQPAVNKGSVEWSPVDAQLWPGRVVAITTPWWHLGLWPRLLARKL